MGLVESPQFLGFIVSSLQQTMSANMDERMKNASETAETAFQAMEARVSKAIETANDVLARLEREGGVMMKQHIAPGDASRDEKGA